MVNKKILFTLIGLTTLGAAILLYNNWQNAGPTFIDPANKTLVLQGKSIYTNNCASCHGAEYDI